MGTQSGTVVVYDLRTATKWRILQGVQHAGMQSSPGITCLCPRMVCQHGGPRGVLGACCGPHGT